MCSREGYGHIYIYGHASSPLSRLPIRVTEVYILGFYMIPIRQPTAFTSPGPTIYYRLEYKTKMLIHAAKSAKGMSTFCVDSLSENYVNTPELSAGKGGGLNQGLPVSTKWIVQVIVQVILQAGSRSESRASMMMTGPGPQLYSSALNRADITSYDLAHI